MILPPSFPQRRGGFYLLKDKQYVSVSRVLDVLAKPSLVKWAAKTVATAILSDPIGIDTVEKAVSVLESTRSKKMERGTLVHSLAESINRGVPIAAVEFSSSIRGYAKGFLTWVSEMSPIVTHVEANLYSEQHGYAGTTDMIVTFGDGSTWIVDIKTGKRIYKEAALQLAAYAAADSLLLNGEMVPMPHIDNTAVLLLGPRGRSRFVPVSAPLKVFLALKTAHEWSKEWDASSYYSGES